MAKKKKFPPPFEEMKNSFIKHYQNIFIMRAILDNIDHDLRFLTTHDLVEIRLICPAMAELKVLQRSLSFLKVAVSKIKEKEVELLKKSIKEKPRKEE